MVPSGLGKTVVLTGLIITCAGIVMIFAERVPFLGRLPVDIHVNTPGFSLYIPVLTYLLLSLVLTIIVNFLMRK